MRSRVIILLIHMSALAFSQRSISFNQGDHVYVFDNYQSDPIHYQVDYYGDPIELRNMERDLVNEGLPIWEICFDPMNYKTITTRQDERGLTRVVAMESSYGDHVAMNTNPVSQPIFYNGEVRLDKNRFLIIQTPQFSKVRYFKMCTNNRVLIFVKNPGILGDEL